MSVYRVSPGIDRYVCWSWLKTACSAGTWEEADWAELEEKARTITGAGWWIDQRDTEGVDLLELLDAAGESDRGAENPFR